MARPSSALEPSNSPTGVAVLSICHNPVLRLHEEVPRNVATPTVPVSGPATGLGCADGDSPSDDHRLRSRTPEGAHVFPGHFLGGPVAYVAADRTGEGAVRVTRMFAARAAVDRTGFEPAASCLQSRRSTPDLPARPGREERPPYPGLGRRLEGGRLHGAAWRLLKSTQIRRFWCRPSPPTDAPEGTGPQIRFFRR